MNHIEKAEQLFLSGFNCAQSVFTAFNDITGLDDKTSLRIASSFGAGMGRMREVCGALTGAFMVAGYLWGYDETDDQKKKEHYERIQYIAQKFREENSTIICKSLLAGLQVDTLPTPSVRTAEYYATRPCVRFVITAAGIIEDMLKSQH